MGRTFRGEGNFLLGGIFRRETFLWGDFLGEGSFQGVKFFRRSLQRVNYIGGIYIYICLVFSLLTQENNYSLTSHWLYMKFDKYQRTKKKKKTEGG